MANMSYCRFQNTIQDLDDCLNELEDIYSNGEHELSEDERAAALRMVQRLGNFEETWWEELNDILTK